MRFSVVFEVVRQTGVPRRGGYAHIPNLDLRRHGRGLAGNREAAGDLAELWLASQRANGGCV